MPPLGLLELLILGVGIGIPGVGAGGVRSLTGRERGSGSLSLPGAWDCRKQDQR
jgi:hypothetical protein